MFYQHDHPTSRVGKGNCLINGEHLHNEIEIVFCTKGSFIAVIDSKQTTVNEGQFAIAFPNQSHYYLTDDTVDLEFYLMILSTKLLTEFGQIFSNFLPENTVATATNYDDLTQWLCAAAQYSDKDDPYSQTKHSSFCRIICAELFSYLKFIPIKKMDTSVIGSLIDYCNNNYMNDIHLSDLEEQLHTNKYYISHIFKNKIKMGFNEYIHTLRIKRACDLLNKNELTVTEIASEVGYNSLRSFNRSFQQIKGMTPSQYKKRK
ncbi:MAG: AraC family transcriptional regulator [Acutalibacteraceae bacterium]|nr:AraC family transcriptional regulator [Acutalibacteraceae bacterium]